MITRCDSLWFDAEYWKTKLRYMTIMLSIFVTTAIVSLSHVVYGTYNGSVNYIVISFFIANVVVFWLLKTKHAEYKASFQRALELNKHFLAYSSVSTIEYRAPDASFVLAESNMTNAQLNDELNIIWAYTLIFTDYSVEERITLSFCNKSDMILYKLKYT